MAEIPLSDKKRKITIKVETDDEGICDGTRKKRDDPSAFSFPEGYTHPSYLIRAAVASFKNASPSVRQAIVEEAFKWEKVTKEKVGEFFPKSWLASRPKAKEYFNRISDSDVRRFLVIMFKELHDITLEDPPLGERKIPKTALVRGVVLVPTGNDNSHSYEIGVPVVCGGKESDSDCDKFYRFGSASDLGNHLTTTVRCLRLPTFEEIVALVASHNL
jgi:hypothetical protein